MLQDGCPFTASVTYLISDSVRQEVADLQNGRFYLRLSGVLLQDPVHIMHCHLTHVTEATRFKSLLIHYSCKNKALKMHLTSRKEQMRHYTENKSIISTYTHG